MSALQRVSRRARRSIWILDAAILGSAPADWPATRARARSTALTEAGFLALGSFLLYWFTLAPTVLWGDDALLQVEAFQGQLRASAGSHPLWVLVAHLFTKLPVGDVAYRVNLVSALFAGVTVGLLDLCLRELKVSRPARVATATAFAVSHTFWAHAVRAEVYTMTLATLALVILFALRWQRSGRPRELVLLGVALGLALSTHVMVLLLGPALLWLLVVRRRALSWRSVAWALGASLITVLPLAYLLWQDSQRLGMDFLQSLHWALFEFDGFNFRGRFFRFAWATLPRDFSQWLIYLVLQFLGPALAAGILGAVTSWRRMGRSQALFLGLLYLAPGAFAFAYDVGDRYVFYLPSYLAFALWIGLGFQWMWQWLQERPPAWISPKGALYAGLALIVLLPVLTYRLTPELLYRYSPQFRQVRRVPGPNSHYFLLWPSRANYYDAREYAESTLAVLPPDAVFLAEPVLATPVRYLQVVEGLRPDVTVRFCCWDVETALAEVGDRPLVVADLAEGIYPVALLEERYQIQPRPPVYVLTPRSQPRP